MNQVMEKNKASAAEAADLALDKKIEADASLFKDDGEMLADRAYLRQLRGAIGTVKDGYYTWATAQKIDELRLPHLSVWARMSPLACFGDAAEANKLQMAAAQVSALADLGLKFHKTEARAFMDRTNAAFSFAENGVKAVNAYINASLALAAHKQKMATDGQAASAPTAAEKTLKLEADAAAKRDAAMSASPPAVANTISALLAAFVALRQGHAALVESAGSVPQVPADEWFKYAPADEAKDAGQFFDDMGAKMGALLAEPLFQTPPSPEFTATVKMLQNVARLVDLDVQALLAWKKTLATPAIGHSLHGPDAEEAALAKLMGAVKDAPTNAVITCVSFHAHAEAKATMLEAADTFVAVLKEFSAKGLKVAQNEAKSYAKIFNASASAKKKVEAAHSQSPPPANLQSMVMELEGHLKATAEAKCKFTNTMLTLAGQPATALVEATQSHAADVALAAVAAANGTAPEPAPKLGEAVPAPEGIVPIQTVVEAAAPFVQALVAYYTARPIAPLDPSVEPAAYERLPFSLSTMNASSSAVAPQSPTAVAAAIPVAVAVAQPAPDETNYGHNCQAQSTPPSAMPAAEQVQEDATEQNI